jgi:hypothetical protein
MKSLYLIGTLLGTGLTFRLLPLTIGFWRASAPETALYAAATLICAAGGYLCFRGLKASLRAR